jgi:nucleoside-diphosphate-sugar epimerase
MRVLITGSDGYIGTVTAPFLLERGHDVVGLDAGFYRSGWLYDHGNGRSPATLTRDIREITAEDLEGFDAVVHMAELSNDPLGQLNPEITYEINHQGGVDLARRCREAGVERFIYTSSCSVYGAGFEDVKTETSETNPQTAYAECKVRVERDVGALAGDDFCPVFLRNATAYGPSPRMRFDIVLNNLSGHAATTGVIKMHSDGSPWRPLVHVEDIARAIACSLEAPSEVVRGEIFNVGHSEENFRVREIARAVADAFEGCELSIGTSDGDNRSYQVSFDKISEQLPGFETRHTMEEGAREFARLFDRIDLTPEMFQFRAFTRLNQLQYLLETDQLDDELYWRKAG